MNLSILLFLPILILILGALFWVGVAALHHFAAIHSAIASAIRTRLPSSRRRLSQQEIAWLMQLRAAYRAGYYKTESDREVQTPIDAVEEEMHAMYR